MSIFFILRIVSSIVVISLGVFLSIFLKKYKNWFLQPEQIFIVFGQQVTFGQGRLKKIRRALSQLGNILILLGFYYLLS